MTALDYQQHGLPHPPGGTVYSPSVEADIKPLGFQTAAYANAFPCGIPFGYRMAPGTNSEGIPNKYVEGYLNKDYYSRDAAPAIFSTENGKRPFRILDLTTFFGALNLWNIICTLYDENKIIGSAAARDHANEIGRWVDNWLENKANETKLKRWTKADDLDTRIFSKEDLSNLGDISDETKGVLSSALKARRAYLVSDNFHKGRVAANDIMSALKHANFENWLVGERAYESYGNGLPSPPRWQQYMGSPDSKDRPPPCYVRSGHYYYNPESFRQPGYHETRRLSALEALKRSAAAAAPYQPSTGQAGSHTIIANGTTKPRTTDAAKDRGKKPERDPVQKEPVKGGSHRAITSLTKNAVPPNCHKKARVPVNADNNVGPVIVASHDQLSPSPLPRKGRRVQHSKAHGKDIFTKPHVCDPNSPKPDDAKQPSDVVPKAAETISISSQPRAPITTGVGRETEKTESRGSFVPQNGPPSRFPQTANRSGYASGTHAEQPYKPSFVEHGAMPLGYAPCGRTTTYANHMPGEEARDHGFVNPAMTGGPFLPQFPQTMATAGLGTHPSPTDSTSAVKTAVMKDGPKTNSANAAIPAFRNGGGTRGNYRGRGRRGPPNQRDYAEYSFQGNREPVYSQNTCETGTTQKWRRTGLHERYQGHPDCRNKLSDSHEYYDCSCTECDGRNRSVWMRTINRPEGHPEDIKSRVKSGFTARFGQVEEVFPTHHETGNAFMVRFKEEASVPKSLEFPRVSLPEKNLSVLIYPAYRSKWIIKASAENTHRGRIRDEQRQPYQSNAYPQMPFGMYPATTYGPIGNNNTRGPHQFSPPQMGMHQVSNYMAPGPSWTAYYPPRDPAQSLMAGLPQMPLMPLQQPFQSSHEFQAPKQEPSRAVSRKKETANRGPAASFECKAQSKPPSEEALDNNMPVGRDRVATPSSHGSRSSRTSNHGVKVSLPLVSPSRLDQSMASEIDKLREDTSKSSVDLKSSQKQRKTRPTVTVQAQPEEATGEGYFEGAKGSETTDVVEATANRTSSRGSNIFTEEEIKSRQKAWDRIPVPMGPRKTDRTVSAENKPAATLGDKVASIEPLPSDVVSDGRGITESMSLKSAESRTVSASSTPSHSPSHRNDNRTSFNSGTKPGSPSKSHCRVSHISDSPTKTKTEVNENQNPNPRAEAATERGPPLPTHTNQGCFKSPGNGRETIRRRGLGQRGTVLDEGFGQGRGKAARRGWKKDHQMSRSIDFNTRNSQQESRPGVGVAQENDSASGSEMSALPTGHVRQRSVPPSSPSGSARGFNANNAQDAAGNGDKGDNTGSLRIQRTRRPHRNPVPSGSRDQQSERADNHIPPETTSAVESNTEANDEIMTTVAAAPGKELVAASPSPAPAPAQQVMAPEPAPDQVKQGMRKHPEASLATGTAAQDQGLNDRDWPALSESPGRIPKRQAAKWVKPVAE
ncbi:hypothetical protein ED733_004794 [Metarhizium rileyi]|uniref:RRM domain-containing protein n=1 Tax=Metarhizium rileyi (strain RCEF 4871) TaxID=1649241 RepID=A0A5C6GGW1_METRR|nr:hypothetical protein ED733_004794 [Metarhizium rileyi]